MAMTSDSGGGGGTIGTAGGGICTISTSDLIGLQNNILTRLLKVEQLLTLITGMDVRTGELSEISDNLGTVTNATLINALRGWVTEGTFTGVAISTLGWTLSDGNTYPIVVMDENGVLQYGFTNDGQMTGASAHFNDYYVYAAGEWPSTADPTQDNGIGITVTDNDMDTATALKPLNSITFQVARDGVYLCSLTARGQISSTTGTAFPYMDGRIHSVDTTTQADMLFSTPEEPDDTTRSSISMSNAIRLEAGQSVTIHANVGLYGGGTASFRHLVRVRTSIIWIAPLE